ncbi:MAG: Cytochrome c [Candidatus Hinthialibacteria bacterium OLB16]|nr:MAG: Cytochrome c [Candidatus Hinthialibacteria bacterium OLB16]
MKKNQVDIPAFKRDYITMLNEDSKRRNPGIKRILPQALLWIAAAALVITLCPRIAAAQETAAFFKQNCASCHTIGGGRLTGPDLKDVTKRQDRAWLRDFIMNPQAKINAGDPYAVKLHEEARGVLMPSIPGMTAEKADFLLDLVEAESALPESQFKGLQISNEPFTPEDIQRGIALFTGHQRLKNGGPACISCHTIPGLGGLGGGQLGPDLTRVYERLQGRTARQCMALSPRHADHAVHSCAMPPLDPAEIHALVALFEDTAKNGRILPNVAVLNFSLLGLGGAVLVLVLFDLIWRARFRSVRRNLVQDNQLRGLP